MIPVFALVGRPNVGKSTLFNRLTKTRDALVANYPGLTRDRKYGEGEMLGRRFMLIDTGGITGTEEGIDAAMAEQSMQAIKEADAVLFIVDSKAGLTPVDLQLAKYLREQERVVYLVANKIDGVNPDIAIAEFFELGLKNVYPTTATHGRGVRTLMGDVLEPFPEIDSVDSANSKERGIKIAIVGRPNVGKSTLVNRILGEDRVVVFDEPGTTRDSIYIEYEREDRKYTLIDTAGIRRRKNISLTVEKFSIVKTLQSIDDANVVVLLIDAREGLVDQDMHLMGTIVDSGRALVLAVNKWDGLEPYDKERIKSELERRLHFVGFADLHFISALHGTGVGNLYQSIENAYASATDKLSTNRLTLILQDAVTHHQPPLIRGRRIKLRYAHAGGKNPPIIVIHGNQVEDIPKHYSRYLEKTFCKALELHGTPIKIEYRSGENPYEGKKNKLTARQVSKKRRLMSYVKKKK
jgi:GTPase|tara:strand:- start:11251 stop:12648 length:1398 start_codon:yes stop_codon:yes gene_type:complete